MTRQIRPSSGNVFADLGFDSEEAVNLRVRSELMIALSALVKKRRLTQQGAAKLLGVTQPRVSDLMRGKVHRFSVDSLIEMLGRAGMNVEVSTRPARGGA
jgi:predicted XRE-type DNA-binding protein